MSKLSYYRIENSHSGLHLGIWRAASAADALALMYADANAEAWSLDDAIRDGLRVQEIDLSDPDLSEDDRDYLAHLDA
jgi:hypothetical protein